MYDRQVIYPWVTSPVLPVSKFSLFILYCKETHYVFFLFFLTSACVCSSHDDLKPYWSRFPSPALLLTHAFVFSCSALTHWNPFPKSDSNGNPFLYLPRGHFGAICICPQGLMFATSLVIKTLPRNLSIYPTDLSPTHLPAVVRLSSLSQSAQIKVLSDGQTVC